MLTPSPRYLVPFQVKRIPHHFVDVLIIGSGISGLRAALEVPREQTLLILSKDKLVQSNSNYAQGGIAGVLDPEDDLENHVQDTLVAGADLCDKKIVEMVIGSAAEEIGQLIGWGTRFDRQEENGEILLGREGGHSHHRIIHALGDATGKEIIRSMIAHVQQELDAQIWEDSFTIDLLTEKDQCVGAMVWNPSHGKTFVWAKQTILCTGGAGQLYRETTNPKVATGDGHAIAYRAGARMADMEFMQFHPTVLYIAGSSRSLISEAVRGEGAHLIDHHGERFMPEYDQRAELAPRDIVSQAIVTQMEKTRHPNVYLDLRHLDGAYIRKRFPGITRALQEFDLDITTDPIPVRPGAHYMIGGVQVDAFGKTSLKGLWAAGEVTSSGLHGANRLASNSLLEGLVYGARAGAGAAAKAATMEDDFHAVPIVHLPSKHPAEDLDLLDIRNSLKSLMWRYVSVRRNEKDLIEAAKMIKNWSSYVLARNLDRPFGWELQNMLEVSRLIIDAAIQRKESRGVHLRTDYPNRDNSVWKKHIYQERLQNI